MKIIEIITPLAEAKLGKDAREHVQAMINFLATQGIVDTRIEFGGKHPRLVFSFKGRPLYYTFPKTPGDTRRASKQAVADLRRLLMQVAQNPTGALPLRRQNMT